MAKTTLTVTGIENLKGPATGQKDHFDGEVSGLALRITYKHAKSWALMYRVKGGPDDGARRRLSLGKWRRTLSRAEASAVKAGSPDERGPGLDLTEARRAALLAKSEIVDGADPAKAKREKATASIVKTFAMVRDLFIERYAKPRNRSWKQTEQTLKTYAADWDDRPITEIAKRDVIEVLDGIMIRGKGYAANRFLAAVRKLFGWAVERDLIETSPCFGLKAPAVEKSRDRVLTEGELVAIWNACDQVGTVGAIVRLLILTVQRKEEVAGMRRSDVDREAKVWSLSRADTKADRATDVPLSNEALSLIDTLPLISRCDYVFPQARDITSHTTISGKNKEDLDRLSGVTDWRIHDLRRTATTLMGKLRIDRDVRKRILNHAGNDVTAIYDRFDYREEKAEALQTWARYVVGLVNGDDGNVIDIRAAKASA